MLPAGPKSLDADAVIALLGLVAHPEGGHYRETFRDPVPAGARAASTAIYYLLRGGEISRWHRVDAAEIWHWYAGAALELGLSSDGRTAHHVRLGCDLAAGERPQHAVPAGVWQSAKCLGGTGAFTLVGCTVAPGFQFSGFEMAGDGFAPR